MISNKIQGGSKLALLALAALLALQTASFGYAGIVKLHKSQVLGGVSEVRLCSGAKPNQTSAATLVLGSNYSIDDTDPTYRIYNIYDAPGSPSYLLLIKGTTYSILAGNMGTTVPPTTTYDNATFYMMGKPDAPTALAELHGYETAKVTWALNDKTDGTGFEYSGVEVQRANNSGYAPTMLITLLGKVLSYAMGELVDGSKLESGTPYWFRVKGVVDGGFSSDWSEKTFTTLSGGGVGGPVNQVWNYKFNNSGINVFAFPFAVDQSINDPTVASALSSGTPTVKDLIEHINAQALKDVTITDGTVVSVFGWFNAVDQKQYGLTNIPIAAFDQTTGKFKAPLDAGILATPTKTPAGVAAILDTPLSTMSQPYQVSVRKGPFNFTLNGTLKSNL